MKNNKFSPSVKKFLKEVKSELVCSGSLRKKALGQLTDSLSTFMDENPVATYGDIVNEFGTPTAFANSFLTSLDEEELKKVLKKSQQSWIVVWVTCILVVIIAVLAAFKIVNDNKNNPEAYVIETTSDGNSIVVYK